MPKIKLSKALLFATMLAFVGLLSFSAAANCPVTTTGCPEVQPVKCNSGCQQVVQKRQTNTCGCPAVTVNCVCNNAAQTCPGSGCGQINNRSNTIYHTGYTLEPTADQYQMSARQQMFDEEIIAPMQKPKRKFFMGSILEDNDPCVRCDKNGSIFGGGPCERCDKNGSIFGGAPCDGDNCKPVKAQPKENPRYLKNYVVFDDDLYKAVHRECRDMAPLELSWVDFRLKNGMNSNSYSRKMGNYRFRIFGCRRNTKNAILNEGRLLEKDMRFIEIFDDMVSDCYNVVKVPHDLCIREDSSLPEYVLTAEITDFFMNVCDEYNWDETKKTDERAGSSEMTVVWRLMDATKTNVLWKGKSVGYGEVLDGEYNGELMLVERAFADAVENLRAQPDFEEQLAQRVSPEEMARQRQALIELQRRNNPAKCQYQEVIRETTIVVEERPITGIVTEDGGSSGTGKSITVIEDSGVIVDGHGASGFSVIENAGSSSTGHVIIEDSGSVSTGHSAGAVSGGQTISTYSISENSGVNSDGFAVVEDSGVISSGYGATEGWINVPLVDGAIIETSGASSTGIEEIVEVEAVDPESGFMTAMFEKDKLCILERPEYDKMGPENVYKVRSSIVSVENAFGKKGSGLLISENFVMTSADLIDRRKNTYSLETINGKKMKARAFRINPRRNTALLMLEKPTEYTPLTLGLVLPPVGKGNLMTWGLFDLEGGDTEGYIENSGKVSGYRYSDDGTAQIVIDTFVQSVTMGGALIDENGRIVGISNSVRPAHNSPDLFLPMETAMKSLGVEICGKAFPEQAPRPEKSWRKPIADYIEGTAVREPEIMKEKDRK